MKLISDDIDFKLFSYKGKLLVKTPFGEYEEVNNANEYQSIVADWNQLY